MKTTVVKEIASKVQARLNCIQSGNTEWKLKHEQHAEALCKGFLPSGSGVDTGTKLDFDKSTAEKLVFTFGYHHMNENGMYSGWTDHKAIVTASLVFGIEIKITGRNRNGIKEYLNDRFDSDLSREIKWDEEKKSWVPGN